MGNFNNYAARVTDASRSMPKRWGALRSCINLMLDDGQSYTAEVLRLCGTRRGFDLADACDVEEDELVLLSSLAPLQVKHATALQARLREAALNSEVKQERKERQRAQAARREAESP